MRFAWKVTLVTLCIIVLSFSVGSYLLVSLSFRSALEREVGVAQEEMRMLRVSYEAVCAARGVTLENMDSGGRGVRRILEESRYFSGHQFRLSTREGQTVYSALGTSSDTALLESVDSASTGYTIRRDETTGATVVHCAGPVALSDGVLYLETVRDISSLFADRDTHYRFYRYLLLLVVVLGGGALFVLSAFLTRPVRALGRAATALTQGDYSRRAEVSGSDEFRDLAESFNTMAQAIERNVQALEDAARRQEDFTASFVHELKTPLTSIIGYADMLRSRDLGEDKRFKAAGYIFSEGKRLENLSLSLMNLLVVGHSAADLHAVSMAPLLEEAGRIARPTMAEKDLTLTLRAGERSLWGDASLLQTLLLNLIDNARKASHPGGEITVAGESIPAGYRVTVTDRGRGIPEQELGKICEAFYMVDKSRSRAEGGAGLGLALCRQIADFHGGVMRFISREGEGTTVEVILGGARHED